MIEQTFNLAGHTPYAPDFADDPYLRQLYAGRRVLVVGATGFLGANCAYALQALGAETTIVARRLDDPVPGFTGAVAPGDLIDEAVAQRVVRDADFIFDFLGYPRLTPSHLEPEGDLEVELRPHINVFLACANSPRKPMLVHSSSRLVYGAPRYLPVDEEHPTVPRCIYAVHKLALEHYLECLAQTHDLRSVIVRLSSPFGPNGGCGPSRLGILNQFMLKAVKGEPITIFGTGEQMRDYVYIDDVIRAFLLLGAHNRCAGEVFNLGGDKGLRLRDAVYTIARLAGDTPVSHQPWPDDARAVETGSYCSNLSKLRRFVPYGEEQSFETSVARTIAWMREQLGQPQAADAPVPVVRTTSACLVGDAKVQTA